MKTIAIFLSLISTAFINPKPPVESKPIVIVELFTSEGCSSCPPADRLLSQIIDEERSDAEVIGLSFHVDYWDYIGWKDPYASKQFTNRQRAYAQKFRSSSIYTPQMVVNGKYEFVGSDGGRWQRTYSNVKSNAPRTELSVKNVNISGGELTAEVNAKGANRGFLNVAIVERDLEQDVKRGENRGRKLSHDNVVRSFKIFNFQNNGKVKIDLPSDINPAKSSLVVYLQDQSSFEIYGGSKVDIQDLQ